MIVVLHGMLLNPPFYRNVYLGGNTVYQSTFHCRLVLELSFLHLSHYVWGLNRMEHLCLFTEHTSCFELAKGRSLSNPKKT